MSNRSRRRLLIVASLAWAAVLPVAIWTGPTMHGVNITLSIAVASSVIWGLFTAVAPILAALTALVRADERTCSKCATREQRLHSVN